MSIATCAEVVAAGTVADRYHALRVKRVVRETADATSVVFDVPAALSDAFTYAAGQFVTFRVLIDGDTYYRSYSMSSSPSIDAELQVTVKRVPGGAVSNWLHDTVRVGDVLDVSAPTGVFVLRGTDEPVVAFAAGSGITPVFSLVKSALHDTSRQVQLLFANSDRASAIFGPALDDLAARFGDRLIIDYHEDIADGLVDASDIAGFVDGRRGATFYLCGPAGFMEIVETTLKAIGVPETRIHIERFTPLAADPPASDAGPDDVAEAISVTITVGPKTKTVAQRGRSTILESARWSGLPAPSTCEAGHCATCMARVVEGSVEMARNDVLTSDELSEGWVLTCQAVPASPVVRVVYEP